MPTVRKLSLLVLATITTVAFAATNASAQAVEVVSEEGGGTECTAAGNCIVVVEGESHITALPAGAIVTECDDQFTITFNHNGSGTVHWVGASESAIGCNTVNCTVMTDEWPTNTAETAAGVVTATINFCLRAGLTELECAGNATIAATATTHRYEVSATILCAGGARRVEVHGFTDQDADGHYPVEFVH